MLVRIVICSTLGMLLSYLALITLGHRVRVGHWLASLVTISALACAAWLLQLALTAQAPPLESTLACALLVGAVVTAALKDWNTVGHVCFTATLLAVVFYISYAGFVLVAARLGPWSLVFGVVLFLLQLATFALLLANTFEILNVVCRTRFERRTDSKHVAGFTPKVSLHVPTHREPPEMVIETLDALARLDYPNFEVLVIDNNTDDETLWRPVEAHCARLGPRFRFFHLMPWPGFKSGALNYALTQTAVDAQIVGIVDADYLVEPNWLSDLVGHFADPTMAFVQTPQDYRDADTRGIYGRALALSYIYFFRISMVSRNESNAIIFGGTMGLLRKSALVDVGGWNEWCITEDAEVSLRLLAAGHQSLYVDRTYGRGMMPLDYSGLKKQRYRWAFGGMQLLRLHIGKLLNPWAKSSLTFAQRWEYLVGGLQWLNDPLALTFTVILLCGATALLMGGSFAVQPMVGATILIPSLFILFSVSRFLWALRVREQCSFLDALRALVVLMGLTLVVTLACVRGLVSREGVFLRTPKQSSASEFGQVSSIIRWELFLSCLSLAAAFALVLERPSELLSSRSFIAVLLVWQAIIYLSAAVTAVWDYRERRGQAVPARFAFRKWGGASARLLPERRTAAWVVVGALLFGELFYLASVRAPMAERIFRADPLGQFIKVPSVMSADIQERAGAMLVMEADASRRSDIAGALSLWDRDGVIVDGNFTPNDASDDQIWRGPEGLRRRYASEFAQRRYLSLWHLNPTIDVHGETATIINDIDAMVESETDVVERVRLKQSDRWVLRLSEGRWKIVSLELNQAPRNPAASQKGEGK